MHHIRRKLEMKIKCLAILLVVAMCMTGCGKNSTDEAGGANEGKATSEKTTTNEQDIMSEVKSERDKFDVEAEFPDLRIGDTVCVATSGVEEPYQYKLTLNSVEFANGEINGFPADSDSEGFTVIDVTLEGAGPDVSYGIVFSQMYIDGFQFYPEHQSEYSLNTFSNPDGILSKGDKVTGRIALMWVKDNLVVEKSGVLTTQYAYTVDESEIRDYVPGEQ